MTYSNIIILHKRHMLSVTRLKYWKTEDETLLNDFK